MQEWLAAHPILNAIYGGVTGAILVDVLRFYQSRDWPEFSGSWSWKVALYAYGKGAAGALLGQLGVIGATAAVSATAALLLYHFAL